MDVPEEVRRLAEGPGTDDVVWPSAERVTGSDYTIFIGPPIYPTLSVVRRIEATDISDTLERVRGELRKRGRNRALWQIGPSATPSLVVERLLELGLRPDDEPILKALALVEPPVGVPSDAEVRRVATRDEFREFYRIQQAAFETDPARIAPMPSVDATWEAERASDVVSTYLAYLDDEPVATGRATFNPTGVVLNGGSTLHAARGRGTYRAIVGARWDDAVERGTPYLTTLARATSYPTLKRLGFIDVCDVQMLVDDLA